MAQSTQAPLLHLFPLTCLIGLPPPVWIVQAPDSAFGHLILRWTGFCKRDSLQQGGAAGSLQIRVWRYCF